VHRCDDDELLWLWHGIALLVRFCLPSVGLLLFFSLSLWLLKFDNEGDRLSTCAIAAGKKK
jgi:hypothetical protein